MSPRIRRANPRFLALALLAAVSAGLWAQTQTGEPEEPEIVLPQFVLEIEDLSIEKVDATLPPEQDLLSPERRISFLDLAELVVEDPDLPAVRPGVPLPAASAGDRSLTSEVELGAGSQNAIVASIDLKTLGADPRFSLQFDHETADGLSGEPAGAGFSSRKEDLTGALTLKVLGNDMVGSAAFSEAELGLQGKSTYATRLSRSATGSVDFAIRPLEWLSISAQVFAGTDAVILGSATPLSVGEYRASPGVHLEARFDAVTLGFSTGYELRAPAAGPSDPLHRFDVGISVGIPLPANLLIEGSVGWHWASSGKSVVPFAISLGGAPVSSFAFTFEAGFRVIRMGLHDLAMDFPWAVPADLEDSDEWFGEAAFQFTILKGWSAHARVSFAARSGILDASLDSVTGLFIPTQGAGYSLASDLSTQWDITQEISLSAGWAHEYLEEYRPVFSPSDDLRVELLALEQTGKWGGRLSATFLVTEAARIQLPEIGLGAFIRISDFVQLHLDAEDLLWFALDGPRWDVYPYEKQGFRIMGTVTLRL